MPDHDLTEEPLQFGEGGRLFGILTAPARRPSGARQLPVFAFLSAGFLHRVGPYRLHVRFARELARIGFSSLRVDLAGIGDSPHRIGLANCQSVAFDFAEILRILDARLGCQPIVLVGLCAGADNAARLVLLEPRIVGLVMLDPVCFPDHGWRGFRIRSIAQKYANPARYLHWSMRNFKALGKPREVRAGLDASIDNLAFRDHPTREQMRATFEAIRERGGRAFSVFTNYAIAYYNQSGQLGRALAIKDYQQFCTELFWPQVLHTYPLEEHRRRLIDAVRTWAEENFRA